MSTDINTSTSNVSTSTLNVPTLMKRFGLIAMIAVLALIMGGKLSGALLSSPTVGGSGHGAMAQGSQGYGYSNPSWATGTDATGAGSITVTWQNPANTANISSYSIATSTAGTTVLCTTTGSGPALATNTCTFTPTTALIATPSGSSSLYVIANLADGTKLVDSTQSAIAISAPIKPTTFTAAVTNTSLLKFTWDAAKDASNNLQDTKWLVKEGSVTVCTSTTDGLCSTTLSAAGLTAGSAYVFTVTSVNAAGVSTASDTATLTVGTPPGAVTGVTVTPSYALDKIVVSWTAPANLGGAASLSYYVLDGNQPFTNTTKGNVVSCAATTATSCTITLATASHIDTIPYFTSGWTSGAANGWDALPWTGVFTVMAVNSSNTSLYSTASSSTVSLAAVPSAPTTPTWSQSGSTFSAGWTAPSAAGNSASAASQYSVQLLTCPSITTALTCTASGSPILLPAGTVAYSFTSVPAGAIYDFSVTAVNAAGSGGSATYATPISYGATTPSAPTTYFGAASNSTLTVSWLAPTLTGGSAVTSYTVTISSCAVVTTLNAACTALTAKTVTAAASATSQTFTGLSQGYYSATVTANNANGAGGTGTTDASVSAGANEFVNATPAAPTVTFTDDGALVTWGANPTYSQTVTNALAYNVASFTVYDTVTGATVCTAKASATQCLVTKTTAGDALAMYTTDAAGVGSNAVAPATSISKVPTNASNAAGPVPYNVYTTSDSAGNVLVSWTATSASVSYYTVTAIGSAGNTKTYTVKRVNGTLLPIIQISAGDLTDPTYSFVVSAVNPAGTGITGTSSSSRSVFVCNGTDSSATCAYNAPASPTTSFGAPKAVDSSTISVTYPSSSSLTFTWNAPSYSDGNAGESATTNITFASPVGGYPIVLAWKGTLTDASGNQYLCKTTIDPAAPTTASCTFTGLVAGSKYSFSVVSIAALTTIVSAPSTAISAYASAVPSGTTVAATNYYNNSLVIDGTVVKVALAGTTVPTGLAMTTSVKVKVAQASPGTVITVPNGYAFPIGAIVQDLTNSGYISANTYVVSETATTITLSAATTSVIALDDVLTVSSYGIEVFNALAPTTVVKVCTSVLTIASASCTISGLSPNTTYNIKVYSANSAGNATAVTTTITTATVPGAPTSVKATATGTTSGKYLVSWTAPVSNGGSAIVKYNVTILNATTSAVVNDTSSYPVASCVDSVTSSATITATSAYCTFSATNSAGFLDGVVFAVTAENSALANTVGNTGKSLAALSSVLYPARQALSPTSAVYSTGLNGVVIGWVNAADAARNTGYTVTAVGGSQGSVSATVAGYTSASYTFTYGTAAGQLTYGSSYVFTVVANNTNMSSAATTATPVGTTAPTAPSAGIEYIQNVNGSAATTGFTLTWSGSTGNGLPLTWSVVGTATGRTTLNGTSTTKSISFPVAGLTATAGAAYTFVITASDPSGNTASYTVTTKVTNQVAPSAPTLYSAAAGTATTAGNGSSKVGLLTGNTDEGITVSYTTGADGSNGVTSTVTVVDAAGNAYYCSHSGAFNYVVTTTATAETCVVDGLTPGTTYTYSIVSKNAAGSSSTVSGTVTTVLVVPQTTPVVTSVVAAPLASYAALGATKQGITVNWTPSTDTGVTGYVVWVSTNTDGSGASASTYCRTALTAASSSCLITGITGNTNNAVPITSGGTYYAFVQSVNAAGVSAAGTLGDAFGTQTSFTSGSAADVPGAPTLLKLSTTAVGSLTASWTAPSTYLKLPVTSYTVTATGNITALVYTCTATASTTCTITGLNTTDTSFAVSVTASNVYSDAVGSFSSALTGTWKGWLVPQQTPIISSIVAGAQSIAVTWTLPVSVTGAGDALPLTNLQVVAVSSTGGSPGKCLTVTTTSTTCTILGVAPGYSYTIYITATNAVGDGVPAVGYITTAKASTAPAPTIKSIVSTSNGFLVTWTPPATTGNGQVVGYVVTATDSLTTQQISCPVNATYGVVLAPAVTCPINGLTVGSTYVVSVQLATSVGVGAAAKQTATYSGVSPEPVMATFQAVTAKQKSVSALTAAAKSGLNNLISVMNDGAQVTVSGYGTTKAIALARANAAAGYLFNNGAAIHVTIKTVISKTVKTALVTVTSN